jgi:ribosome recycling factor
MDETSVRTKMQHVMELTLADISSIRTGRASASVVSDLSVLVYGGAQKLKIQELASINVTDSQTIVIDPWDKSIIGDIKKGIMSANVGLNPSIDGEVIRIILPSMTTEDRQKFVKLLGAKLENGRVMVRQVRADIMKDIKTTFEKKEVTEDQKFAQEKKLQDLTDEFVGKINEMGKKKEEELLQI